MHIDSPGNAEASSVEDSQSSTYCDAPTAEWYTYWCDLCPLIVVQMGYNSDCFIATWMTLSCIIWTIAKDTWKVQMR